MSTKALKLEHAPAHDKSLVEIIQSERSNLVVPKAARQKKKIIEETSLGSTMTKKILQTAVEQLEEVKADAEEDADEQEEGAKINLPAAEDIDENDEIEDIELDLETNDEESRQLFEMFKNEIVAESNKLNKKLEKTSHSSNPEVIEIYKKLGVLLKNYKSGKLPKAVNVVASQKDIPDWYDLLMYSNPFQWSPNAVKAVTVLFAQTASDKRCRLFFKNILLEYVKNMLDGAKKLPRNIWDALVAASRRAKSFVLGVMIPLASEGVCTPKEVRVISALVTRVKLPGDLVNSFLVWLCEGKEITLTRTIFVARFVQKGKALAVRATDAVFGYFMQFAAETEVQPLIWHKALLDFAKNYARDLTTEQKEMMVEELLVKQRKAGITEEIKKIIIESPTREEGQGNDVFVAVFENKDE